METKRNNRAIGDPLPMEPRRGKHRQRKDKNYCKTLKGEHDYSRVQLTVMFEGRPIIRRPYCVGCHKQGHIEYRHK